MKYKICKIIAASQLEEHTKDGWFIEESFFQDEPALGLGSTTLACTDQYGNQQYSTEAVPVVALSRRFYVVSRTEEVERAERIEEQKKHIEFLEKSNNELRAEVEKAEREVRRLMDDTKTHHLRVSALDRIKQALGQERFDELVSDK